MAWKTLNSKNLFSAGFFNLRVDECELPDGRRMPRYYVMEFLDWVNVIALTEAGQMILVEQHRHAAGTDFLELPGGAADPGETPRTAAERELREETGFAAAAWVDCGFHFPNPALQNNRMHTFLALECRNVGEPTLDPFEDLRTVTLDPKDVYARCFRGEMKHSLIIASPDARPRGPARPPRHLVERHLEPVPTVPQAVAGRA